MKRLINSYTTGLMYFAHGQDYLSFLLQCCWGGKNTQFKNNKSQSLLFFSVSQQNQDGPDALEFISHLN